MLRKTRPLSGKEVLEYLNKFKETATGAWTMSEFNFFDELYDAISWSLTYVIYYNSQSKVITIYKVLSQEELCVKTIKTGTPNTPPKFFSFFSDIVYHYPEDDQIDKYYPEEDQIDNCATTANKVYHYYPEGKIDKCVATPQRQWGKLSKKCKKY